VAIVVVANLRLRWKVGLGGGGGTRSADEDGRFGRRLRLSWMRGYGGSGVNSIREGLVA